MKMVSFKDVKRNNIWGEVFIYELGPKTAERF